MHQPDRGTVGIVAGYGQFPFLVAEGLAEAGSPAVAVGYQGNTDPALARHVRAYKELKIGQVGKMLAFFKAQAVSTVCFAGGIHKPSALSIRPDFRGARIIARAVTKGDDALLRSLIAEIESEGFEVVQAADFVPALRPRPGLLTPTRPSDEVLEDVRYGVRVCRTMGSLDIGQCVVVRKRMVCAVEALEGTDAAIARGTGLGGAGASVVKLVKPEQDRRVDLPALGLTSVETCIAGKVACLAFNARETLFFDLEEAIRRAERARLCLLALNDGELPF